MKSTVPLESNISLLGRIHIAHCAAERARMYVLDDRRFGDEFDTARMWTKYKCFISNKGSFVESY